MTIPDRLVAALADRYRIERELGAGGMATVYLAADLKHERKVAIKVLKPELAAVLGAERFVVEIKTTAALSHPHILPLFDSGEAGGFLYYVMPYIQGETIRETLNRETQLGVDDAVRITREIADALDYAHRAGVIHRDIKPENILLHDGRAMVMDFGIALAVSAAAGGRMTETGLSLGTPHYMSPEQATAEKEISGRSDVYSLASVLYEMLTGQPPHLGGSAQQIIMKIITEPAAPVTMHRKSVPPHVAAAVAKALEKLPADRFASAKEFAAALNDRSFTTANRATSMAPSRRTSPVTMALGAALVVTTAVAAWALTKSEPASGANTVTRFSMRVGEAEQRYLGGAGAGTRVGIPSSNALALSPTAPLLVYAAWTESGDSTASSLFVRRFDEERATPIPGTDGGERPFFSPDGEWVGFLANGILKRVRVTGGAPEVITTVPRPVFASWGDDGNILYTLRGGADPQGLYRVPATGGTPLLVLSSDTTSQDGRWAQVHVLPGSRVALLVTSSMNPARARIAALDLSSRALTPVLSNAQHPVYAASGHLLFMRNGTLMAAAFDAERAAVRGEPVAVLDGVVHAVNMPGSNVETGTGQFSVSASGNLAYARGGVYTNLANTLLRVTPNGAATPLGVEAVRITLPRWSPTGDRVLFGATPSARSGAVATYVFDLARGVTTRVTGADQGFYSLGSHWSPDGQTIVFPSDRAEGGSELFTIPATGGQATPLAPNLLNAVATGWSASGVITLVSRGNIWTVKPGKAPVPFLESPAIERYASVSPDGRWMVYTSDQGGLEDVYVRPYPGPDPAVQVSAGGATSPAWSPDGRRLYFLQQFPGAPTRSMMAVEVVPGSVFRHGRAVKVMPWPHGNYGPVTGFDVARDGSFLTPDNQIDGEGMTSGRTRLRVGEIHMVLNFLDELRARVPR